MSDNSIRINPRVVATVFDDGALELIDCSLDAIYLKKDELARLCAFLRGEDV